MTFGHPWLRHSNHPERAVVSTDVVRVSELAVCTLKLSFRVFTLLPDVRKPKTLVLTFWTLIPESFGNFQKHVPLYNHRLGNAFGTWIWSLLCSSNSSIKMSVDISNPDTWLVSHPGYSYLSFYLIMTLQKSRSLGPRNLPKGKKVAILIGTWKFTKRLSRSQF
jgi:hypothetical protein